MAMIIFILSCRSLDYLYAQRDEWERVYWHNFYNTDKNIDNLFLGSSHVFCDINPYQLDTINGMNNYNMATSGMRLNASYYSLKEAISRHDISNVYLELYYDLAIGATGDVYSSSSVANNWGCTDYMKPSLNKLNFIVSMCPRDKYLDTLFPFIRFRDKLFDSAYVGETVVKKMTTDYKNYLYKTTDENGTIEYMDKGFHNATIQLREEQLFWSQGQKIDTIHPITESSEEYLRKIIELCKNENINIVLFITPIYELQMLSTGDYDLYCESVKRIAGDYQIDFYDFNLCKQEYLDIQHREYFMNMGHLNAVGSWIFTDFFWKVVNGTDEKNKEFFFSTYKEKVRSGNPEVFGLISSDGGNSQYNIEIASNVEEGIEYRIQAINSDGEEKIIQNYSENRQFLIPSDEHGLFYISTRQETTKEEIQNLTIEY